MSIEHVLAVVPVTDLARSQTWYETLFGRAADNNPMPNLVEWQVVPGGWVQVFADDQHAGSTVVNFAVQDLDAHIDELRQRVEVAGQMLFDLALGLEEGHHELFDNLGDGDAEQAAQGVSMTVYAIVRRARRELDPDA